MLIKTYRKSKMKLGEFCMLHNVSTMSMKKWMEKYDALGIEGLAKGSKIDILPEGVDRTEENYKNEILKLRIENERLKKNYTVRTTEDTDQGSVYSSFAYNELIHDSVILRSMSRVGTPGDNPVNESLNGWIKEELFKDLHLNDCKNREEVEQCIKNYVLYYNSR